MDKNNRIITSKDLKTVTISTNTTIEDAVNDIGSIKAASTTMGRIMNRNWIRIKEGNSFTSNQIQTTYSNGYFIANGTISDTFFMFSSNMYGPVVNTTYTLQRENTSYNLKLLLYRGDGETISKDVPVGQTYVTFNMGTTDISYYSIEATGLTNGSSIHIADRIMLFEGSSPLQEFVPYREQTLLLYANQGQEIETYLDKMYIELDSGSVDISYNTKERLLNNDDIDEIITNTKQQLGNLSELNYTVVSTW